MVIKNLTQRADDFYKEISSRIDKEANSQRRGALHLTGIVRERWKDLCEAFDIKPEATGAAFEQVYGKTEKLLDELGRKHCRVTGADTYTFAEGEEPRTPEVQLDLARFVRRFEEPDETGKSTWGCQLTEEGKTIINDYRQSRGFINLDGQREINKKYHNNQ